MKILHINVSDYTGGADIACTRHCEAMLSAGYEAKMLVLDKRSKKVYVQQEIEGIGMIWNRVFCRWYRAYLRRLNPIGTFSIMRYGHQLDHLAAVREADVIFLHWVNNNMLSVKGIERILRLGKPTFWFMHDMFPITGGCHHSLGCGNYKTECNNCPMIENQSWKHIAHRQLQWKIKSWSHFSNLYFVTPSHWLADCVKESRIARGHDVYVAPNVIDTILYRPLSFDCKSLFGLNPNKKTILLGAAAMKSIYKGMQHLRDCLLLLDPGRYEGLVIGNGYEELVEGLPILVKSAGYLSDDLSRVLAYNACDTFVISSVAENYPNVVLEAMACGKPCVGYNTGGIPELICHGESGYITPVNTPEALAQGIDYLFADDDRYRRWALNARLQIDKNNSYQHVEKIHTELKAVKQ